MNTAAPQVLATDEEIRKALTFFKVMAFVVGVGLLVLVVEMILRYPMDLKGSDNPLDWWPRVHGFLYMVYAVAAFYLGLKVRWSLPKLIGVFLAGCIPFLSFVIEVRVRRQVEALLESRRPDMGDVAVGR